MKAILTLPPEEIGGRDHYIIKTSLGFWPRFYFMIAGTEGERDDEDWNFVPQGAVK